MPSTGVADWLAGNWQSSLVPMLLTCAPPARDESFSSYHEHDDETRPTTTAKIARPQQVEASCDTAGPTHLRVSVIRH